MRIEVNTEANSYTVAGREHTLNPFLPDILKEGPQVVLIYKTFGFLRMYLHEEGTIH
jgi:hypothetical protein